MAAEVFISSRYTALAKPPREALITQLRFRGVPVWDGVCTGDVIREVSRKLDATPLSIVLGTADYAEDTGVNGNTYTEIQLIQDSQKEENKPFLFIKMCTRFTFMSARVILPPSTIHDFQWLPNTDGSFSSPPTALINLIVQKYRSMAPSVSSVTARVQEMRIESRSSAANKPAQSSAVTTSSQSSGSSSKSPSANKPAAPAGSDVKLHKLAKQGKHEELLAFLSTYDVSLIVNSKYGDGWTPLYAACDSGHAECAKLLLDRGANINTSNKNGWTPLYAACCYGHAECAKLLLDRGANISTANKDGWTPLYVACSFGRAEFAKLLLDRGANINTAEKYGGTPLLAACECGRVDCVTLLLDRGANISTADKFGQTPLYAACEYGRAECAKLLLDRGANINTADKDGRTPLYAACYKGHAECVKLLLDRGANINTADKDGRTPLEKATEEGYTAIVNLLKEKGAK